MGRVIENDKTFGVRLRRQNSRGPSVRCSLLHGLCRISTVVISALLASSVLAREADSAPEHLGTKPPASAFYRLAQFAHPQLSPSGKYMSAKVRINGKLGLLVKPLEGNEEPYFLDSGDRWTIRRTLWVSDHEILIGFSRTVGAKWYPGKIYSGHAAKHENS